MRAIILGGSGFIGRGLENGFDERGWETFILTRREPKRPNEIQWDGVSGAAWADLVDESTVLVNLAGASVAQRWTPVVRQLLKDSRVLPSKAMVEACADRRPAMVVQASAIGIYGPSGDEATEDTPPSDDFLGRLAVEWEEASAPFDQMGVPRAIARIGIVLEKDGGMLGKMAPPFRFFVGGPLGNGRQCIPWVHREDLVQALLLMIDRRLAGPYNIVAPNPVSMDEFARTLGKILGRPALFRAPAFVLRAMFGEMADYTILAGRPVSGQKLTDAGFQYRYERLEEALRAIFSRSSEAA
ncbi:MAG: TIGR01777 family protein [Armatimonadetes bacterium]|nr:TIGR01777 family protein [Armatimonadota bacterium]